MGVFFNVAMNDSGTAVAGASGHHELLVIRMTPFKPELDERRFSLGGGIRDLALSPFGDKLAIATLHTDEARDWDATMKWGKVQVVALDGSTEGSQPSSIRPAEGPALPLLASSQTKQVDYRYGRCDIAIPPNVFDDTANASHC